MKVFHKNRIKKRNSKDSLTYHVMLLIPVIIVLIYNYIPMLGVVMSFQNFHPGLGFLNSEWIGLDNYRRLLMLPDFFPALKNTLIIAIWKIAGNLVVPVMFALMLNEIRIKVYKKTVQTITYLPYFLSWVVIGGILIQFLSPGSTNGNFGIFNTFLQQIGIIKEPIYFLGDKNYFRETMIISDIWKNFGFNSIIYLAALTGIDPILYEAATIDGANRFKQTLHVTIPGIAPFIALMTILSIGNVLNAGFDQIFQLYHPAVYEVGDIIDTLVYRLGMVNGEYSLATAVGLFKSLVSLVLIVGGYKLADKYAGYRVF